MTVVTPLDWPAACSIADAILWRQGNVPGETLTDSVMVVLFNYGDKMTQVSCVNGEWSGTKADIPRRQEFGVPLCPHGHVMVEHGPRVELAFVEVAS